MASATAAAAAPTEKPPDVELCSPGAPDPPEPGPPDAPCVPAALELLEDEGMPVSLLPEGEMFRDGPLASCIPEPQGTGQEFDTGIPCSLPLIRIWESESQQSDWQPEGEEEKLSTPGGLWIDNMVDCYAVNHVLKGAGSVACERVGMRIQSSCSRQRVG